MKLDARARFYLAADGERDGNVNVSGEHAEGYPTIEAALKAIANDFENHGAGVAYIYECIPVKRVTAVRITVEDIEPQPPAAGKEGEK